MQKLFFTVQVASYVHHLSIAYQKVSVFYCFKFGFSVLPNRCKQLFNSSKKIANKILFHIAGYYILLNILKNFTVCLLI